jgi:hypothetical protein
MSKMGNKSFASLIQSFKSSKSKKSKQLFLQTSIVLLYECDAQIDVWSARQIVGSRDPEIEKSRAQCNFNMR